jgi:F-type H+-transporting ATPase subunit c
MPAANKEARVDTLLITVGTTTGDGLKAVALGVGAGLGSIGVGIGLGNLFGKVIEAVTRQPEMREEITSIQWLAFALIEAVAFYTFVFGLIAFFLS